MNNTPDTSSAEDMSAAVINAAVEKTEDKGEASYEDLANQVEETAEKTGIETPEVTEYVDALRNFSHDAAIGLLPPGVGGQFDGEITIATSTVEVGPQGIDQTIAQMQEVYDHELYHALNHHTDAMMTWNGDSTVVIAGEGFSTTELVEGLTVAETGEEFVSQGYKQHKSDLLSAIAKESLSLDDVRDAVNEKKDLTAIDDRARKPEAELALSA